MSSKDGFASGFLVGTLIGGVLGGILGVLFSRRLEENATEEKLAAGERTEAKAVKGKTTMQLKEERIEEARRSLEDKIAQLNEAIDEVRQQLRSVNGTVPEAYSQKANAQE